MTYDEFAEIALSLPGTHEKVGKIECDLFRDDKHMARLREKKRAMAIRLPWETCDDLLAIQPGIFFSTPHYDGYPYVLVWLKDLEADFAEQLLRASWEAAPEDLPTRRKPKI